jgi:hypothetical protein
MSTLAEVVGVNCGATVTFNDARAAEEDLAALRAVQSIVWARVFTRDGTLFAEYVRQNTESVFQLIRRMMRLNLHSAGRV